MTLVSSPPPPDRPNTGNQQAEKERLEMLWIERDVGDLQALGEDGEFGEEVDNTITCVT